MHYRFNEDGSLEAVYSPHEPANEKTWNTHQHMGVRDRIDWGRSQPHENTPRRHGDIYGRQ